MGKKKEIQTADGSKRERRGNKEIAVVSLQDALSKVFKSFSAEDYLTVIINALKDTSANISKKTYADMGMQELIREKKTLQEEINVIDKRIELLASGAPAKEEKKEDVKDAAKEETNKEEEKK